MASAPKSTSTPLNPPRKPGPASITRQGTPRRYSLSETNSTLTNRKSRATSPLLAPLSFRDNVSLYEETKSSGLARRICAYSEAAKQESLRPTHQEQYSAVGLFPIVHLFKKKPPILEQTKKVTIKLSSPESMRSYSPQLSSLVLDGIRRGRIERQLSLPGHHDDAGAKSVLDALKEISRKRIRSNEGQEHLEESGKRVKTSQVQNGTPSNSAKRVRTESPPLDATDSLNHTRSKKRFCIYDEFAASKSSSDFVLLPMKTSIFAKGSTKRKTISTSTESLNSSIGPNKQVKLINVETQTEAKESTKKDEKPSRKEFSVKVFDDIPLERIRKSRLAALMGNIMGKDVALLSEPNEEQSNDVTDEPTKTVEVPVAQTVPVISQPPETEQTPEKSKVGGFKFDLKSTPVAVPVSKESSSTINLTEKSSNEKVEPPPPVSIAAPAPDILKPSLTAGPISFVKSPVQDISKMPSAIKMSFEKPSEENPKSRQIASENTENTLKASIATTSATASFSFSKPVEEKENALKLPAVGFSFGKPSNENNEEVVSTGFSFGKPPDENVQNTITKVSSSPTIPVFSFGKPAEQKDELNPTIFGKQTNNEAPKTVAVPSPALFAFGNASGKKEEPQQTSTVAPFSFVTPSSKKDEPPKPPSMVFTYTPASEKKEPSVATPFSFGTTEKKEDPPKSVPALSGGFNFSKPSDSQQGGFSFGTPTSKNSSEPIKFTSLPSSNVSSSITVPSFGFGTDKPPLPGATVGQSKSQFTFEGSTKEQPAPPLFGNSNATSTTTTTVSTSLFGTSNGFNAKPPVFGTGQSFKSGTLTTEQQGFNTVVPSTTSLNTFGTATPTTQAVSNTFSFGSGGNEVKSSPFKSNVFGTNNVSSAVTPFGGGASFATPTTTVPSFGGNTSNPNNNNVFSTPSNNGNTGFGFGVSKAKPNFGGFGSNFTTQPFGNGGVSTNPPPTSNETKTTGFGFGTSDQKIGFGAATFGASTTFGANNTPFGAQQPGGAFNFSSSVVPSNVPFKFGANNDAPKPSFNFTGAQTMPTTGAFPSAPGSSTSSGGFGTVAQPSFPGTPPAGGMFSIGAGSSSGSRPRTQLRAKRRT
ncbi:hypothetical protein ABEB36_011823 [Hypothenemus hampei]|uniref:Uncharacterized protein n=1 Tax=Hypothenemus hampei TaxID=57062 RepID=A0ABD1E9V0_HYPHA